MALDDALQELKDKSDANDVYMFEQHMWKIGKRPDPDYKYEAPYCHELKVWIEDIRTRNPDHGGCDYGNHQYRSVKDETEL